MRAALPAVVSRGLALFVGAFLLLCLAARLRDPALDSAHWLVDLRGVPSAVRVPLLAVAAAAAAWWGLSGGRGARSRRVAGIALGGLALAAGSDSVRVVAASGAPGPVLGAPPLSVGLALALGACAWRAWRAPAPAPAAAVVPAAGAAAAGFALALMVCFGTTDYRRPADAVVVLGARAYADGRASPPLGDRVRTAAALVRDGLAPVLLVSGGPGDGDVHETDVMRRIAIAEGVDPAAVVADRDGLSTRDTARNASRMLRARGAARALVVSNGYHLPRVKAAFDAEGFRVYTVPAAESGGGRWRRPWYVVRETAAWWAYWLRERLVA